MHRSSFLFAAERHLTDLLAETSACCHVYHLSTRNCPLRAHDKPPNDLWPMGGPGSSAIKLTVAASFLELPILWWIKHRNGRLRSVSKGWLDELVDNLIIGSAGSHHGLTRRRSRSYHLAARLDSMVTPLSMSCPYDVHAKRSEGVAHRLEIGGLLQFRCITYLPTHGLSVGGR